MTGSWSEGAILLLIRREEKVAEKTMNMVEEIKGTKLPDLEIRKCSKCYVNG